MRRMADASLGKRRFPPLTGQVDKAGVGVSGVAGRWGVRGVGVLVVGALLWAVVAAGSAWAQPGGFGGGGGLGDVVGNAHESAITELWGLDVFAGTGCEAGFCPGDPLLRWTMAVWLVRILDGEEPAAVASSRFSDVDGSLWWAGHVERFAELGVTAGYGDGTFRPYRHVSRAHMAAFLARAFDLAAADDAGFSDIEGNAHSEAINALAASGITGGYGDGTFRPDRDTSRAHAAAFISRAMNLVLFPAARRFVAVSTGDEHTCALRADSTAVCWGHNGDGQSETPEGSFSSVSAGSGHSCGLRTDGTVECWGDDRSGQAAAPGGTFSSVSAGSGHSCGLRTDGTVECWGADWSGQAAAPGGTFSLVSAGSGHSCGLRTDGTVECWGADWSGQAAAPGGTFSLVSAGSGHSCGLRTDGTVECWGADWSGQAAAPGGSFSLVSAGSGHSCGLRTDGTVECWGADWSGQAAAPGGSFSLVSAGSGHSCGLRTDGTVECWGADWSGQAAAPGGSFSLVSAGSGHSCGLRTDGTVECWGDDLLGRAAAPGGTFSSVSAGSGHSCGLRVDARILCWGNHEVDNEHGQNRAPRGRFISVSAGIDHGCGVRVDSIVECWGADWSGQAAAPEGSFSAVSAGDVHTCGLRTDGTAECWGDDADGPIDAPEGSFSSVSAGSQHSCGLRTDGTVECWGRDDDDRATAPGGSFSSVSAGSEHSCGLRTDGTVECWGADWSGQAAAPEGSFSAVSAGSWHSCGLRTDGTVECWGADWSGQATAPEGRFSMVAAGVVQSCGVRDSGAVVCWGNRGRLADPPAGSFSAVSSAGRRSCALRADGALACWAMAPVVAAPHGVHRYRLADQPDPSRCRPYGVDGVTAGFPLPRYARRATGPLRVAVLFVDFPNAAASHTTQREAALGLPLVEERLESSSYGKLDIEFTALHEWLRAAHDYEHYLSDSGVGGKMVTGLIAEEAIRLADPGFDFTGHGIAIIVMPSSHFAGGNAGGRVDTQEGPLETTRINAWPREDAGEPSSWDRLATHELAHNLGLLDMYPYDASRHELPEAPAEKMWVDSGFGPMGLRSYFLADDEDPRLASVVRNADGSSYTSYLAGAFAGEMLAWSRWQLGWLDVSQIRCIITPEATVSLSPVAAAGNEVAMAAVPLSDTEVIVIESRRKIGNDAPFEHADPNGTWTGPSLLSEGVLVYTVDASVGSGGLPLKVAGDAGDGQVDDYPILTAGQSVTVHGYTIAVVSDDGDTHTVTITKLQHEQAGD